MTNINGSKGYEIGDRVAVSTSFIPLSTVMVADYYGLLGKSLIIKAVWLDVNNEIMYGCAYEENDRPVGLSFKEKDLVLIGDNKMGEKEAKNKPLTVYKNYFVNNRTRQLNMLTDAGVIEINRLILKQLLADTTGEKTDTPLYGVDECKVTTAVVELAKSIYNSVRQDLRLLESYGSDVSPNKTEDVKSTAGVCLGGLSVGFPKHLLNEEELDIKNIHVYPIDLDSLFTQLFLNLDKVKTGADDIEEKEAVKETDGAVNKPTTIDDYMMLEDAFYLNMATLETDVSNLVDYLVDKKKITLISKNPTRVNSIGVVAYDTTLSFSELRNADMSIEGYHDFIKNTLLGEAILNKLNEFGVPVSSKPNYDFTNFDTNKLYDGITAEMIAERAKSTTPVKRFYLASRY